LKITQHCPRGLKNNPQAAKARPSHRHLALHKPPRKASAKIAEPQRFYTDRKVTEFM
jgi:hypothetical protein